MPATTYTVASAEQLSGLSLHFDHDISEDEEYESEACSVKSAEVKVLPEEHPGDVSRRPEPKSDLHIQSDASHMPIHEIFFSPIESTTSLIRLSDPVHVNVLNENPEPATSEVCATIEAESNANQNIEQDSKECEAVHAEPEPEIIPSVVPIQTKPEPETIPSAAPTHTTTGSEAIRSVAPAKVIEATLELESVVKAATEADKVELCPESSPKGETEIMDKAQDLFSEPSPGPCSTKTTFTISTSQLHQLIKALAAAPLITSSVHRHGKLDFAKREDTPGSDSSGEPNAIYTLNNRQFISSQAQTIAPFMLPICGKADGVAVINATNEISTFQYASFDVLDEPSARSLGTSSHLAMPADTKYSSTLHIHNLDAQKGTSKIMLHTVTAMQTRVTEERLCYISTEQDVTQHFYKAALAELSRIVNKPIDVVDHLEPTVQTESGAASPLRTDDWLTMAEELQELCETADTVDSIAKQFRTLDTNTCSMQTLTLISELSHLKADHRYLMLARFPEKSLRKGSKIDLQIPLLSEKLVSLLVKKHDQTSLKINHLAEPLSQCVCDLVYHQLDQRSFELFEHGSLGFVLRGVPVYNGRDEYPRAWVIYIDRDAALHLMRGPEA